MRFAKIGFLSLVLMAIGFVGNAEAGTDGADMAVSATGEGTCEIAVNPMNLGEYDGTAITDIESTLTITCTNLETYSWYAEHSGGNMLHTNGTNVLAYTLTYGDGKATLPLSGSALEGTGTGAAQTTTIYGSIAADALFIAGSYSDTVTFTINW